MANGLESLPIAKSLDTPNKTTNWSRASGSFFCPISDKLHFLSHNFIIALYRCAGVITHSPFKKGAERRFIFFLSDPGLSFHHIMQRD